jgi:hypothetical protein
MDNASVARIPVAANNITYVFNLILEHAFKISMTSSFDNASLFLLMSRGNFTFNLNFLGLISMSKYSKKFFTVGSRDIIRAGIFAEGQALRLN